MWVFVLEAQAERMEEGEGKRRGETKREAAMYTNKSSGIWTVGQRECSLFLFPLIFHCRFYFSTAANVQ